MFDIKDIYKTKDEKELVTTFVEPFMFSFKVKNNDEYFFMGHGHRAIKDGEIFRAVINGKNIATF